MNELHFKVRCPAFEKCDSSTAITVIFIKIRYVEVPNLSVMLCFILFVKKRECKLVKNICVKRGLILLVYQSHIDANLWDFFNNAKTQ